VAGVIGRQRFIYDLWGDTVNLASRMESTGVTGQIQVSETTYLRTRNLFSFEPRGEINVKGRGNIKAYLIAGLNRRSNSATITQCCPHHRDLTLRLSVVIPTTIG
jgi:class 3 adenylate cyclase